MALNDKNLIITPSIGSTNTDPKIEFVGASTDTGPSTITATIYSTNNGTLSFDGTEGTLFSISNNKTVLLNPYDGNVGVGTTNPTSKLYVVGDVRITGVVTASSFDGNTTSASYATSSGIATYADYAGIATYATSSGIATYATSSGISTYATNAGIATNLKGGSSGNVVYQSAIDTTNFVNNGVSGQVLLFDGSTPYWGNVSAANGSFGGITVYDEETIIGTSGSVTTLKFKGDNVLATASGNVVTVAISSNIVGTSLSISGISTLGTLQISAGIVTATVGVITYYGDGSKLSGVTAESGVSIIDNTTTNSTFYVGITSSLSGLSTSLNISSTKLTFNPSTGNLVAGGTVTANSDEKLKANIKTIDNALDKVLSLRGVEFDRIDTGEHQIGVIAQEVEKIMPEVVYPKSPMPNYETKSVAYANLVGLLIEAIKEQNVRIEELERRLGEV
jgi:hypothetical protein